jgi:hypothetical protein
MRVAYNVHTEADKLLKSDENGMTAFRRTAE